MTALDGVPVTLRNGQEVLIRPIAPEDAQALHDFHEKLSDRTIYFRHFAVHPHLTEKEVARFTNVDHEKREAYVAIHHNEILGVGRWDSINPELAEVAFVIRDDYQGQGLGVVLFELLAQSAWTLGIRQFVADMLPQNRGMVRLMEDYGNVVSRTNQEGVVEMVVDLREVSGPTLTGGVADV